MVNKEHGWLYNNAHYLLLVAAILFSTLMNFHTVQEVDSPYTLETTIGCGSDSMGVEYNCGQKIVGEEIKPGDKLYPGMVYVYQKNETLTVIHRLVLCLDEDCNMTVFKGDNNRVADPVVSRDKILYRVTSKET